MLKSLIVHAALSAAFFAGCSAAEGNVDIGAIVSAGEVVSDHDGGSNAVRQGALKQVKIADLRRDLALGGERKRPARPKRSAAP